VGFTPGKLDAHAGVYRVSTEDAHAWPEIWLAGLGWTHLFDPTPPAPGHLNSAGGSDLPNEPKAPGISSSQQPTANPTVPTTPGVTQPGVTQPAPGTTPATPPPVEVKVPDHSGGAGVAVTIAVIAGAVLLALLAAAGTILFAKSRRRATRRT